MACRLAYVTAILVALTGCPIGLVAFAESASSEPEHPTFRKASSELEPRLYRLYRIVDRISRANKLTTPWRVQIIEGGYPSDSREQTIPDFIPISAKIFEALVEDQNSLACLVAAEQARHQLGYVSAHRLAKLESEGNNESLLTPGQPIHDLVFRIPQPPTAEQLKAKANLASLLQQQNLDADQYAFRLMARSGYDYHGCQQMFEALLIHANDTKAKLNIENRINRLTREQINIRELKEPIPFSVTADQKSFRLSLSQGRMLNP
jgi:hypothetical protein